MSKVLTATTAPDGPFIRESLGDTGSVPLPDNSLWSASPDIIPRTKVVDDPNTTFATAAAWGQDLGQNIEAGSAMNIYLRAANAATTAKSVTLHLYYAKNATFNPRSTWLHIQDVSLTIPARSGSSNGLAVIDSPILWEVPVAEKDIHQCLICYITDTSITAPPSSFPDFVKYLRGHNTSGLRNLTIVDANNNDSITFKQDVINSTTSEESRNYAVKFSGPIGTVISLVSSTGLTINESFTTTKKIQKSSVSGDIKANSPPPLTAVLTMTMQLPASAPTNSKWTLSITEQTSEGLTQSDIGAYHYASDKASMDTLSLEGYLEEG